MSSEKKENRWWIWTYKGKFMRATNDLRGWDGVTLCEGDVITEVYGADYVTELTQERDELRRKLWDWNGQFETQEARLEAVTAERDELKKQLEQVKATCKQCEWCNKWDVKEFFRDVCGQDVCEECKENR